MPRLRSVTTRVVVNVDDDYAAQLLRSGGFTPVEAAAAEPQDSDLECEFCGRSFKSKAGLNSHLRTHEEE